MRHSRAAGKRIWLTPKALTPKALTQGSGTASAAPGMGVHQPADAAQPSLVGVAAQLDAVDLVNLAAGDISHKNLNDQNEAGDFPHGSGDGDLRAGLARDIDLASAAFVKGAALSIRRRGRSGREPRSPPRAQPGWRSSSVASCRRAVCIRLLAGVLAFQAHVDQLKKIAAFGSAMRTRGGAGKHQPNRVHSEDRHGVTLAAHTVLQSAERYVRSVGA